jgi:hypothetical protein
MMVAHVAHDDVDRCSLRTRLFWEAITTLSPTRELASAFVRAAAEQAA